MKKLSIITINYNNLDGLIRTIESVDCVSAHLRSQIEYIVVDGCSSDGSIEFIEKHNDKFQQHLIESDTGIYDAINKGIKLASGDYILILNSGDTLRSEELRNIFAELHDEDIYYCDVEIVSNGKKHLHLSDHTKLTYRMAISHQGALVSKRLYDEQLYDQSYKLAGDFAFFNKCAVKKCEFVKINHIISEFEAGGRSDAMFFLSRLENLKVLYRNRQYVYMVIGFVQYIREALHLWITRLVH